MACCSGLGSGFGVRIEFDFGCLRSWGTSAQVACLDRGAGVFKSAGPLPRKESIERCPTFFLIFFLAGKGGCTSRVQMIMIIMCRGREWDPPFLQTTT